MRMGKSFDFPSFFVIVPEGVPTVMSVKICLLKSGEEVVADVKELVNADDQFVGYVFHKPVLITYNNPEMLLEEDAASLSLSFQPWFPLSKTRDIPVSPDWVITAVDPINQIEQMYTDSLLKKKDDADTSDETADSGSGDNPAVILQE